MVQNNGYRGARGKSFCPAASSVPSWGRGVTLLFLQPSKRTRRLPSGMFSRAVSAATTPFTRQHTRRGATTLPAGSAGRRPPSAEDFGEEAQRPHPTAPQPHGRARPPALPPGAKRPRDPASPAVPASRRRESGAAGARLTGRPRPAPAPRRCPSRPLAPR